MKINKDEYYYIEYNFERHPDIIDNINVLYKNDEYLIYYNIGGFYYDK